MKLTTFIAIVICAAGSAVWADAPSSRPSTRPAMQTKPNGAHAQQQRENQLARRAMRLWATGPTNNIRPATPQEWDEMMAFMQDNSPARWHVLSTVSVPPVVKLDAIRRWRNYTLARDHLPAVADLMVQRFQVEDDLFALTLSAQENADTSLDEFYDKIHAKVEKLVQLDLAERQTRIDNLEKLVDQEKTKLASDQAQEEKTVDQRTNAILNRLQKLSHTTLASTTTRPDGEQETADQSQQGNPGGNPGPQSNPGQPTVNLSNETEAGGK
jgi:hypothetical protein